MKPTKNLIGALLLVCWDHRPSCWPILFHCFLVFPDMSVSIGCLLSWIVNASVAGTVFCFAFSQHLIQCGPGPWLGLLSTKKRYNILFLDPSRSQPFLTLILITSSYRSKEILLQQTSRNFMHQNSNSKNTTVKTMTLNDNTTRYWPGKRITPQYPVLSPSSRT